MKKSMKAFAGAANRGAETSAVERPITYSGQRIEKDSVRKILQFFLRCWTPKEGA